MFKRAFLRRFGCVSDDSLEFCIVLEYSCVMKKFYLLFCRMGKKYYFCRRFLKKSTPRKGARVVEEARLESE